MDQDEQLFAGLIQDYIDECLPLAESTADGFVALERAWEAGETDPSSFGKLRGWLHTVKGNSAMMGLTHLQGLAHALEDLCGFLAAPSTPALDFAPLLIRGGGLLVEQVRTAAAAGDGPAQAERYVAEVRRALSGAREPTPAAVGETSAAGGASAGGSGDTIRIDTKRLDVMLEIFGETLIAHASVTEAAKGVLGREAATAELAALDGGLAALGQALGRLERSLMEARLVPLTSIFSRFGRLVRDLAHDQSKRVRLEIAGGETRLDKTIVDRLGEPLIHLVSNAVIHGIEPHKERAATGKPAEAHLRLAAEGRSDRVLITVEDDGRGLDRERLLAEAAARGLRLERPSDEEIWALAFLPGLSTAGRVSELAGRGVGLDVVAGAIRSLGGGVTVASIPGRGTRFTLSLPLTLAVLRALLVEAAGERYVIPLSAVAETLHLGDDALHHIDGRGMLLWRGEMIPVLGAPEALGQPDAAVGRYCVVLQAEARRRGLLVDRLLGHQEVVVKGLDPALGRLPVISGAAILGDGRIACILDPVRLLERRLDR